MNLIKNIGLGLSVALLTFSCIEATLDKKPELAFSEDNAFENFQVSQTYAYGFYTIFPGYNLGKVNSDWDADLMMQNNTSQGSSWIWGRQTIPTSSSIWDFSFVRRVNIMLDNLEESNMTEAEKNHWRATCYFFRAYDYYSKISAYGDVPWIDRVLTDEDELLYAPRSPREEVAGNMMDDLLFAVDNIFEPGTNGVGTNTISSDVVRALISRFGLFEGTWRKYHGLSGGDDFLRESVKASEQLITNNPTLHPNYNEVFNSESLDGVSGILLFQRYDNGILTHYLTSRHRNSAGNWDITKRGADSYLMQDGQTIWNSPNFETDKDPYAEFRGRDLRMLYTITPPFRVKPVSGDRLAWEHSDDPKDREYIDFMDGISVPNQKVLPSRNHAGYILRVSPHFRDFNEGDPYNVSRTGYKLFKYYNRLHDIQNNDYNDAPIFRMGEVLINYAEAKWELGEFNQSVADMTINKLRERGNVAPLMVGEITADFDPTRDPEVDPILWEIRRERGIELMAEGFRFDDLRRWKKMDYTNSPKLGRWIVGADVNNRIPIQGGAEEGYIQFFNGNPPAWEDYQYLYPVPSEEIALNPSLEQNPGW
ncbi:RagB/SusD family nutrient uptake outer membrane protein [Algoriphagus machipongonensis]|uniref:Outer membrane protein probably involved in nutrient binding n=1 Tax=Algoriphagus machipongonensis TaxID=388413 RepID=A3HT93_9BACT|nr:RagB/SusD family nutrient uptake outer membrane protein [Algoriphagus machipongonensis]EAZ83061.1 putative outer membrane protein probably involved in nutrient binding [Algoriphagus machipongonensis]